MLRRRADGERRERKKPERKRERIRERKRWGREKRHPVAWWVRRYEGIRADRRGGAAERGEARAKRGEARRGEARRGPGPARARTERARAHGKPSKNVTLLAQLRSAAHLYLFISVDLFVGGAAPARCTLGLEIDPY